MSSSRLKAITKEPVDLNFTEAGLDALHKSFNGKKKISAAMKRKILAQAKETAKHFNSHGWDLDYQIIIEELMNSLLGFNPEWLFLSMLMREYKKPLFIFQTRGSVLSKKPNYEPKPNAFVLKTSIKPTGKAKPKKRVIK